MRSPLPNVHALPLYPFEQSMFELDGRHFKSAYGKDYLDHLLASAEANMKLILADADDRVSRTESRLTVVEGRVDLVRHDNITADQRINVVVARAAEEADAIWNEK